MKILAYQGSMAGFREVVREMRKAAMAGVDFGDEIGMARLRKRIRRIQIREIVNQILNRTGGDAA